MHLLRSAVCVHKLCPAEFGGKLLKPLAYAGMVLKRLNIKFRLFLSLVFSAAFKCNLGWQVEDNIKVWFIFLRQPSADLFKLLPKPFQRLLTKNLKRVGR